MPLAISTARRTAELRAQYNIRIPDVIHLVTALDYGADALLTNDVGLKKVSKIQILILGELEIEELSPSNQVRPNSFSS